ncbi:MAG: hypothetical protein EHM35_01445 [Planctomycetaceae bacterium]|nr:MAG: hypothetical protein EHM35_01445 [Planctomycetaceae bacterium]
MTKQTTVADPIYRGYQRLPHETREEAQLRELERCWKRIEELELCSQTLVRMLKRLEYACYHDGKVPVCPVCGVTKHGGEEDGCSLHMLLSEAKK